MRVLKQLFRAVLLLICVLSVSACDSVEERAEKHYQSALSLIAEGDVDRAMVELRNVFDLDGGHIGARNTMAELQLERGNLIGAYRQYLTLAERYPEDIESRIILAELAFDLGDLEQFERHGAQAVELAPDDPRVSIVSLVRDYRAAIADENADERRNLSRQADVMLGEKPQSVLLRSILMDNAIQDQDFIRALAEIDWLIANEPRKSRNYQERLRILALLGDRRAVEEQLLEMIEIFPEDPTHTATLIRYYLARENISGAEEVLRDRSIQSDPEDPVPTIDLIRFLAEFREPETVRAEIDRALAERADPVPFTIIAAAFEFELGNRTDAIAMLEGLLPVSEPSEKTRDVKIALAKMLLITGNEVGARTNVEEVLAEDSTHPEALKLQAAWQIEADEIDAAIGGLRIALDQEPQDAKLLTLIAQAYTRAGQLELAKDFLAQAVPASGNAPAETLRYSRLLLGEQSYRPAEDILLAALRLDPTNVDILIVLGQLYLQTEEFGRVRGVVDTLRRIGGELAIQAANGLEADRLSRQRGIDEAVSFLERVANEVDATLAARIALIRAKLTTGDPAGALEVAQQVRQQGFQSEALDLVLALSYAANGDLDEAEMLYRDLLAADQVRPRIWLQLSQLKLLQGDLEAAKAVIDEGLIHAPENVDLLWAKASFLERDGAIDAAIEIYEVLYEQNSGAIVIANNLASLLATYRDDEASLDRAWSIARRFRDTEAPALADTYGWILHSRGGSAEAVRYLETAAQGLPSDAIVQYHLGQTYLALDRSEDALAQFRRAAEAAGPADTRPQIEEARALIESLQAGGADGGTTGE